MFSNGILLQNAIFFSEMLVVNPYNCYNNVDVCLVAAPRRLHEVQHWLGASGTMRQKQVVQEWTMVPRWLALTRRPPTYTTIRACDRGVKTSCTPLRRPCQSACQQNTGHLSRRGPIQHPNLDQGRTIKATT